MPRGRPLLGDGRTHTKTSIRVIDRDDLRAFTRICHNEGMSGPTALGMFVERTIRDGKTGLGSHDGSDN